MKGKLKEFEYIDGFLLALSPEVANYEKNSETEIIIQDIKKCTSQCIKLTLVEGQQVLSMEPFPWEWITDIVGSYWDKDEKKYIEDPEFYHKWLKNVLETLEQEAIKQGKISANWRE